MSLTQAEKAVGRVFLSSQQEALADLWAKDPGAARIPPYLNTYRHDCAARGGQSWGLELHEVYRESPELWVCYCSEVGPNETVPHDDCDGGVRVPAARLAFIYQEGRCPDCGLQVRSGTGRLEDAHERPPRERKAHA
jgi:hypothetical protein